MLNHILCVCANFKENPKCFRKYLCHFTVLLAVYETVWQCATSSFTFFVIFSCLYLVFLFLAILTDVWWDVSVVLILIFPVTNEVKYLFMWLFATYIFSLVIYLFKSFPIFIIIFVYYWLLRLIFKSIFSCIKTKY